MKELQLKGSFYDMGLIYGRACKKQITKITKGAYIMASLSKKPGSQPFNPNLWHLIPTLLTYKKEHKMWQQLALGYEKFIETYHPDAIDFMKGIAQGSETSYIDILSLNIATENIITCSIWGAAGSSTRDKETFLGMNADEETATKNFEIFLDIHPDWGYRYKVTGLMGWAGYNHGMNEQGLAIASTLLWTRPSEKTGLKPPMLVLMKALNTCATVDEVKALFESIPNHALGTVFYVADQKKLMRIECTPEKRHYELLNSGTFGNTNLIESDEMRAYDGASLLRQNLNALQRQVRMKELLNKYDGEIDRGIMERIASDHGAPGTETHKKSICQHSKGFRYNYKTLVSFIAHPQGKQFWIYEGNPCEKRVKHYTFD